MKEGKEGLLDFFKSKESKINRITELTDRILISERNIECLSLLHKIVVL